MSSPNQIHLLHQHLISQFSPPPEDHSSVVSRLQVLWIDLECLFPHRDCFLHLFQIAEGQSPVVQTICPQVCCSWHFPWITLSYQVLVDGLQFGCDLQHGCRAILWLWLKATCEQFHQISRHRRNSSVLRLMNRQHLTCNASNLPGDFTYKHF